MPSPKRRTHQQVVDDWLKEHVPARYQYQVGPGGRPLDAFHLLCKDALWGMPGNQQRLRREGAKEALIRLRELGVENGDAALPDLAYCEKVLTDMGA